MMLDISLIALGIAVIANTFTSFLLDRRLRVAEKSQAALAKSLVAVVETVTEVLERLKNHQVLIDLVGQQVSTLTAAGSPQPGSGAAGGAVPPASPAPLGAHELWCVERLFVGLPCACAADQTEAQALIAMDMALRQAPEGFSGQGKHTY